MGAKTPLKVPGPEPNRISWCGNGSYNWALSDLRFARCRAMDAVHAGTALPLRERTGQAVHMATYDTRLKSVAAELNLN